MTPPTPTASARPSASTLERMDIATLVHRAQVYLDAGHPNEAMPFIRTAVRRAPLRRDLRRLLVRAIESGADVGETDLKATGDDWQRQYRGEDPEPIEMPELKHTFMRPREHPGSPKLVLITIAFVMAGVGAMIFGWTRYRAPSVAVADAGWQASENLTGADALSASDDPDDWILLEVQEYESAGRIKEAIERAQDIEDKSKSRPVLVRLYGKQAIAFERAGKLQSARKAFENAIAHDADNLEMIRSLGGVLYELGRHRQPSDRESALGYYEQAESMLDRALIIDPQDTASLLTLARIEIARDDNTGAARYLRQIVKLDEKGKDADKAREILAQRNLRL